jgi:HEAT repeat protein
VATRASASTQISTLIENLGAGDATTREAAVARLTVIGARAVERLLSAADSPTNAIARTAALRALEGIADPRALPIAFEALGDPDAAVAAAAASLAGVFVRGSKGAAAVDRLIEIALDRARPAPVRVAALRGLRDLAPSTLAPVFASLADDTSVDVQTAVSAAGGTEETLDPLDLLTRGARGSLSWDPQVMRQSIARAGQRAPLPVLLQIIERIREHERGQPAAQRPDWTAVRAAAHLALAQRGSRLAVYDLRESIEAARAPLPVEFLAALSTIGDASCVEAIAGAFARARDQWWRDHLVDAFRAIVKRDKLTRRHAAIKKIEKKSKAALDALWPPRP